MARIVIVSSPASVTAGQSFAIDVAVEHGAAHDRIELELARSDTAEGPWIATAVIGGNGTGLARFQTVALAAIGAATLRCRSTSHAVISVGTSILVR